MRILLDTNVLFSAVLHDGLERLLLRLLRREHTFLTSKEILAELERALKRRGGITEVRRVVQLVARDAEIAAVASIHVPGLRDPGGAHVLSAAVQGRADYAVTGDRVVLRLKAFNGIPIVRPADAVRILGAPTKSF